MRLENDSTTRIELEIDAALKLLGETIPPAAMTSRIHRSLETATCGQARRGRLFWVPATCAAMAAVVLFILIPPHSMRENSTSAVETAKMVGAPTALPDRVTTREARLPAGNFHERKLPTVHVHPISHLRGGEYRHSANLLSYPLTRQEKLLVRFVQTAKPADLRDLNPEYQAKMEAEQEAKFAAYLKSGGSSSYNGTTEAAETN